MNAYQYEQWNMRHRIAAKAIEVLLFAASGALLLTLILWSV